VKILFVTNMYPSPAKPAFGAFVRQQAQGLRRLGHIVDIVNIRGFKSSFNYLIGAIEVRRRTRAMPYDIVHAHYGLSGVPASCRVGAPLVITLHGSDVLGSAFERFVSRAACHLADAVIVVSEEMKRRIHGTVIPCGVDLNVFTPHDRSEARRRLALPPHKRLILFPFDPARRVKRYDLARAAVNQLQQEAIDVELVTAFNVDNSEMPWYYSAADAMILCSDREGSPTSVKEALACNLPVVATAVGDLPILLRGVLGTRLTTPQIQDIAHNLREVLAESEHSGCSGRQAMEAYHQARIIGMVVDVYKRALQGRDR
jgi:glycosyltransferase involved in cell wall biosynthesis